MCDDKYLAVTARTQPSIAIKSLEADNINPKFIITFLDTCDMLPKSMKRDVYYKAKQFQSNLLCFNLLLQRLYMYWEGGGEEGVVLSA